MTAAADRLFWLDMEMTGLDPATCGIIEAAAIVTDLDLTPQATYEAVVFQPPEVLEPMDEWNQRTHGESGLLARVPNGAPLGDVERELVAFARSNIGDEGIVLCGNSIGQDKSFVDLYMPDFAAMLHYRVIDVSSFKELLSRRHGLAFQKQQSHRALDDVRESIAELAFYLQYFTPPKT